MEESLEDKLLRIEEGIKDLVISQKDVEEKFLSFNKANEKANNKGPQNLQYRAANVKLIYIQAAEKYEEKFEIIINKIIEHYKENPTQKPEYIANPDNSSIEYNGTVIYRKSLGRP